jgi:transposase
MASLRTNVQRVKRFRELKATLRTARARLLIGCDIGKRQHVAQVRLAHTAVLEKVVAIPNTLAGFRAFWRQVQAHQQRTGVPEVVVALEPTGTYHQALAQFLEGQGADVVLVSNAIAHLNRRTQDGTWDKSDPKDAANLADLLEQGKVLVSRLPEEPADTLRRIVQCLRHARTELASCQARWRNTLRPALAPTGEPLPATAYASLPARLRAWEPAPTATRRRIRVGRGWDVACYDLTARVAAATARIGYLEGELEAVAATQPAFSLLQTIPGVGPTVAAILLAEIGDIAGYTTFAQLRKLAGLDIIRLQSGQWAGTPRISRCGRPLLRWALYQAALGASRTAAGQAAHAARLAKRAGDRHAGLKAMVEGAAHILRTVWGVWRRGLPYDPTRAPGRQVGERPAA